MTDNIPFTPEAVVQRQLEAYNAHDLATFAAHYAPDVAIARQADGKVVIQGRDELSAAYGQLFDEHPDVHCNIPQRMVVGNYVLDYEHVTGYADGREIRLVCIYEVRDGLITRTWMLRE